MKMIVHFGKYKGRLISEIPSGYLYWLAENCDNEMICEAADYEFRYRDDHDEHWEE